MTTVLITQCLQRDFADPIGQEAPLPNRRSSHAVPGQGSPARILASSASPELQRQLGKKPKGG